MKQLLLLILLIGSIPFYGKCAFNLPPDTTTKIVDKGASLYLIDQGKEFYAKGLYKSALAKFREAGRYLDITVLDHLIVSKEGYYSYADEGAL